MKRIGVIALFALSLLCFAGAAAMHRSFMHERTLHRASYAPAAEDMSPLMAFTTVAMGGFRGIIADLLWLRGIELQAQGRFFELAQLADWITKLEPHFVPVWAFHAWNMAYNISVLFPDPDDRWRWIQHGIQLIRDEGLRLNPRHPELYWELAWLYQHKIGYVMDSAHWEYKLRLAEEMEALLENQDPDAFRERKLCPELMDTIKARYGPIDWRHPSAHALYWAYRGRALKPEPATDTLRRAVMNCERIIMQSVYQLFRQGTVFTDSEAGLFVGAPKFEMLPYVIDTYEEALARYDVLSFHESYFSVLANAVFMLYYYGKIEESRELFEFMLDKYPGLDEDLAFEQAVEAAITDDFKDLDHDIAMAMVEGALYQSCLPEQEYEAIALVRRAERIWMEYMGSRVSEDSRRRTGLAPLPLIHALACERAEREK